MPELTRREKTRQATRQEILDAARRLLAAGGPSNVSVRAVAGEIGMTAPGIYRYFPRHEDLLIELNDRVAGELLAALVEGAAGQPADDPGRQLVAAARAFRRWCIDHPREFQLAFGLAPAPPGDAVPPHCDVPNVRKLCASFFILFVAIWRQRPFDLPDPDTIDAHLVEQMQEFVTERMTTELGEDFTDVPVGLVRLYADAWSRLYGTVAIEIYGHMRFIVTDGQALFDAILKEYVTTVLGVDA
ncbi:MAG: TetR family transcriptional regulator [Streptosporangiales bacterium]|nr:TetR family transcriptional regulator [Streptosporangiales bacterium]